ncbi:MAG: hypothetical protein H6737_15970 [Alphaproteobacteria bacterium]|nr:hypothetical protein [Alphaproteobacteria bacterium]
MSDHSAENEVGNIKYALGLLGGGLCLGFGILLLWYSFGYPGGGMANNLNRIGFSGLDNIHMLDAADFSIGMIVVGALTMIFLNAGAWRDTNGY